MIFYFHSYGLHKQGRSQNFLLGVAYFRYVPSHDPSIFILSIHQPECRQHHTLDCLYRTINGPIIPYQTHLGNLVGNLGSADTVFLTSHIHFGITQQVLDMCQTRINTCSMFLIFYSSRAHWGHVRKILGIIIQLPKIEPESNSHGCLVQEYIFKWLLICMSIVLTLFVFFPLI